MSTQGASPAWSPARRAGFRFAFVYFVLFFFPFPLSLVPKVGEWLGAPWDWFVVVVGKRLLHQGPTFAEPHSGAGDTTYGWISLALTLLVALVASIAWSAAARAPSYPRLHDALRILVRYGVAQAMLGYGLYKVFKTQFPFPGPGRLLEPYGQSTPMALLWTFMGYSTAYTLFGGLAECTGLLLLFRRTTALGALAVAAVMSNVFMLNMSYDVPVKIYSAQLLVAALWLAAPEAKRLLDFFLRNRPTSPSPERPLLPRPWMERARLPAKVVLIAGIVGLTLLDVIPAWKQYGDAAPRPAMYGVYEVETFSRDGVVIAPLLTETARWRRLLINASVSATVQRMDDSVERYTLTIDEKASTLTLAPRSGEGETLVLTYTPPAEGRMTVDGKLAGAALHADLLHRPMESLPLVGRGFHWVNEYPNNK